MRRVAAGWAIIGILTVVAILGVAAAAYAQFISYADHAQAILEGNWQSCRESDGHYSERVYDNTLQGIGPFELHLGPYHEFALFRGIQEEHRDHSSPDNLLRPFNVEVVANRGAQTWDVAGLHIVASLGGGSKDDCESWFISLKRAGSPSSE